MPNTIGSKGAGTNGREPEPGHGGAKPGAVVFTVSVAVCTVVPVTVTDVGEIVQVEPDGAPLQASATVPRIPVARAAR